MNVAVFYPCRPYATTIDVTEGIVPNNVESLFPVVNYPPQNPSEGKREEFLRLLRDPAIDALMVWRGGRIDDDGSLWKTSLGLLNELDDKDWEEIKEHKKIIIGYSDASYLLCALLSHGIECFYGPNYNSQLQASNEEELKVTLEFLEKAIGSKKDYTISFKDKALTAGQNEPWVIHRGVATGRLVGGNLHTIYDLLKNQGRSDLFSLREGDVLLLEEVGPFYWYENGVFKVEMIIEKMMNEKLNYLKEIGVFSKVSGVLFGRSKKPRIYDKAREIDLFFDDDYADNSLERRYFEECVLSAIPKGIPVLANAACSHTHPMVTLPLGKEVTLNATECTLTIHI